MSGLKETLHSPTGNSGNAVVQWFAQSNLKRNYYHLNLLNNFFPCYAAVLAGPIDCLGIGSSLSRMVFLGVPRSERWTILRDEDKTSMGCDGIITFWCLYDICFDFHRDNAWTSRRDIYWVNGTNQLWNKRLPVEDMIISTNSVVEAERRRLLKITQNITRTPRKVTLLCRHLHYSHIHSSQECGCIYHTLSYSRSGILMKTPWWSWDLWVNQFDCWKLYELNILLTDYT